MAGGTLSWFLSAIYHAFKDIKPTSSKLLYLDFTGILFALFSSSYIAGTYIFVCESTLRLMVHFIIVFFTFGLLVVFYKFGLMGKSKK